VTFDLYGPGDTGCSTPIETSTAAVTGDGTYQATPFVPGTAGTYEWIASYGGDAANAGASGACGASGQSVVVSANPPGVVTGAASGVTASGASLSGSVTPNGAATAYVFEYGPSLSFGSISAVNSVAGSSTYAVSAEVSGLASNTTYYYRLVGTNSAGTTTGTVMSFDSGGTPLAPAAVTLAPTASGDTTAGLVGTVNPEGQATAFTFEYGPTEAFGTITPVVELDSSISVEPVSASLSGLTPNSTYFYRVVASNAAGTSAGAVESFATGPGGAPIAATGAATGVTVSGASLSATVNPDGLQTSFTSEYGQGNNFGSLSAVDNAGSGQGSESVTLPISGLLPNTEYVYRVDATNADGTTAGSVASFTTPPRA
jgi:phosphodiesterase/alkaline phosphatase D-like protein